MKKCTFFITCKSKEKGVYLREVQGYCETYTDGGGNTLTVCYNKVGESWVATEKTTGFALSCLASTRKIAESNVKALDFGMVQKQVALEDNVPYIKMISEAYASQSKAG